MPYQVLLSAYRALLSIHRALSSVHMALLSVRRALLIAHGTIFLHARVHTLKCVALCCSVLQCVAVWFNAPYVCIVLQCVACVVVCCSMIWCVIM